MLRPKPKWLEPLFPCGGAAGAASAIKVLSQAGPTAISIRGITQLEGLGYPHVFEEPDSEDVTLTWPRTIPLREGDRGPDIAREIVSFLGRSLRGKR